MKPDDDKKPLERKERRPYEPPAITTEEVFERQALACQGKIASCERAPISRQGS
ncbi:MAG: hypothetical protein IT381_19605 [Deltaproteobacteria bacterium]|nr:hypothetical protein [Deltaproteobacteria bacterium]